jgi:hypothetical protein
MTRLFEDTTPEAEAVLVGLLREMSPSRKIEMVCELNGMVRRLAIAGLRERHPGADKEEIRRRLADLLLGKDLAAEVYGTLPSDWEPTYTGSEPLNHD